MSDMNRPGNACRSCKRLLEELRVLDFAIQETVLFLDAYPDHPDALQYYHALLAEREGAMADYQKNCGPLTVYGNESKTSWDWTSTPWPWEPDAN